jgi:uncharacterized protein YjlB
VTAPEVMRLAGDGTIPNSPLPLLLFRAVLPADAAAIEQVFAPSGWGGSWRDGIYPLHHFHSIAHEALGLAAGAATVQFGGPHGPVLPLRAGDCAVIPAGVGHCRRDAEAGLLVVGAYPGGMRFDLCRGEAGDAARVRANVARVPLPDTDPVGGSDGALTRLWRAPQG